eukprot:SAG31_NODE_13_length_37961_cov_21.751307_43_plen_113_part_00
MTLCGADSGGCAVPGEICGTPSANFTIPRFEICGSVEGERFVAYTVDVSLALPWRHEEAANDHKQENVRVTVTKRYSDFVRLHKVAHDSTIISFAVTQCQKCCCNMSVLLLL